MSEEEKTPHNPSDILMAILKEERTQTDLLKPIHWIARAQQIALLIGLILGVAYIAIQILQAFIH